YMAPEILLCSLGYLAGYDHRVDWHSLGICFYEMLIGRRPFEYAVCLSPRQSSALLDEQKHDSAAVSVAFRSNFLYQLHAQSEKEFQNLFTTVGKKNHSLRKTAPVFIPRSSRLNWDPTTYNLGIGVLDISSVNHQPCRVVNSTEEMEQKLNEFTKAFVSYNREYQYRINAKDGRSDQRETSSRQMMHDSLGAS
ncbi:unnamed protein product, partial [Litomosoides sigmodontis]